jgi:hypothetical protein
MNFLPKLDITLFYQLELPKSDYEVKIDKPDNTRKDCFHCNHIRSFLLNDVPINVFCDLHKGLLPLPGCSIGCEHWEIAELF